MIGETAELAVLLKLHDGMSGPLAKAGGQLNTFNRQAASVHGGLSKISSGLATFGKVAIGVGAGLATGLAAALKSGIASMNELDQVQAQTAAAIKSTGQAAGVSAKQIRDQANALEDLTTIDDKTIQRSENLLLTFTNIRNSVGANNDIFNQATKATLDLSTALGQDVKQSAIQLGKALNDPIKGITALRRVGVAFTDEQQKQIKTLVKHNDLLAAQKIILAELAKEFGGSAAAQAGTFAGQQRRLADAFEDLKISLAQAAVPGLTTFMKGFADLLRSPEVLQGATNLGKGISNLFSPVNLNNAVKFAKDVLPGIADGLKLAGEAGKAIFGLWSKLPKELQGIAVAALVGNKLTGGLVASGIGDLLKVGAGKAGGLFGRGNTPLAPLYVQNVGPGGGAGGPGGVAPIIPLVLGAAAAAGVVKEVIDTNEFRQQRADLQAKGALSNAQALALQIEARGGMGNLDRRSGEGAITAFRNEATTYADALKSAHAKLDEAAKAAVTGSLPGRSNLANSTPVLLREEIRWLKTIAAHGQVSAAGSDKVTKALLTRSEGGSVQTLTGAINSLKREQKQALAQGDTKTAAAIGRDIGQLTSRLERVEAARAVMLTGAVDAVAGILRGGFGSLIGAIGAIHLPAYLGAPRTAASQDAHAGRGGAVPITPRVGIERNRHAAGLLGLTSGMTDLGYAGEAGGEAVAILRNPRPIRNTGARTVSIKVNATMSARQNDSGSSVQRSYGPTPTRAGAAGVLL